MAKKYNVYTRIREELAAIGITKAVANNMTYDGTPCVTLRWNGAEEYVKLSKLDNDPRNGEYNEQYIAWLKETYADVNVK